MNINVSKILDRIHSTENYKSDGELAFPKPGKKKKSKKVIKRKQRRARLIDPKALKEYARRVPYCEWCAYELSIDPNYLPPCTHPTTNPHHIFYKSQGGPDIFENFATLWNFHHNKAHDEGQKARIFIFKKIKKIAPKLIKLWDPDNGLN